MSLTVCIENKYIDINTLIDENKYLRRRITELNDDIVKYGILSDENKHLIKNVEDVSKENEKLKGQVEDLLIENEKLKKQIEDLLTENKQLKEQVNKLLDRINNLENKNTSLENQVLNLTTRLNNIEYTIALGQMFYDYKLILGKKLFPEEDDEDIRHMNNKKILTNKEERLIFYYFTDKRKDIAHGDNLYISNSDIKLELNKQFEIYLQSKTNKDAHKSAFDNIIKTLHL